MENLNGLSNLNYRVRERTRSLSGPHEAVAKAEPESSPEGRQEKKKGERSLIKNVSSAI